MEQVSKLHALVSRSVKSLLTARQILQLKAQGDFYTR